MMLTHYVTYKVFSTVAYRYYCDAVDVTLTVSYIWYSKKGVKTTCSYFLTVPNATSIAACVYISV